MPSTGLRTVSRSVRAGALEQHIGLDVLKFERVALLIEIDGLTRADAGRLAVGLAQPAARHAKLVAQGGHAPLGVVENLFALVERGAGDGLGGEQALGAVAVLAGDGGGVRRWPIGRGSSRCWRPAAGAGRGGGCSACISAARAAPAPYRHAPEAI
jgi:hypothetical protein